MKKLIVADLAIWSRVAHDLNDKLTVSGMLYMCDLFLKMFWQDQGYSSLDSLLESKPKYLFQLNCSHFYVLELIHYSGIVRGLISIYA